MEVNMEKNVKAKELELNKKRREIFIKAAEEAEKIKKTTKGQDISCGKVVCSFDKNKKNKQ